MARAKSSPPVGTAGPAKAPLAYLPLFSEQRVLHFYKSGWRPAYGWAGLFIFMALGMRLAMGLPIPGVVEVLAVMAPVFLGQLSRSFEKFKGVAG